MITGDQQATAAAIGQQIGILDETSANGTILCEKLHENQGLVKERRISRRASELLRQTEAGGGTSSPTLSA